MFTEKKPMCCGDAAFTLFKESYSAGKNYSIPDFIFNKLKNYTNEECDNQFRSYPTENAALCELGQVIDNIKPMLGMGQKYFWCCNRVGSGHNYSILPDNIFSKLEKYITHNGMSDTTSINNKYKGYETEEEAIAALEKVLEMRLRREYKEQDVAVVATPVTQITKVKVFSSNGASVTAKTYEEAVALVAKAPTPEVIALAHKVMNATVYGTMGGGFETQNAHGKFQSIFSLIVSGDFEKALENCDNENQKRFVEKLKNILWG